MSLAKQLLDVQEIDLARDEAVARLSRVVAALRGNPAVVEARRHVASAEASLGDVEPLLRDRTLEREGVKEHIEREEGKLYGGRVTAPKELQNLQLEVQSLRRRLAELDDTTLDLMVRRDEAAEGLTAAVAALQAAETNAEAESIDLEREKEVLTARVRALDAQRAERVAALRPADVQLYERLRKSKGGRAIAQVTDGNCGACGMHLPLQDVDRVTDGEGLVNCPGCGRILNG